MNFCRHFYTTGRDSQGRRDAVEGHLTQVEGLGAAAALGHQRGDGDVLRLAFVNTPDAGQTAKLKAVLAEHLRGFREAFGKGGG
jgi:hypothetical protein